MEPPSKTQLEAMGLEERREPDEHLGFSAWERKLALHNYIKAQNATDKPQVDEIFRFERGTVTSSCVRCNMGIHVIRIQASITSGDEEEVELPTEHYLCKAETGVWSMKYLTSA